MTATKTLTERVGQMLKGRYRIDHVLDTGDRSTVYAGVDQRSGRVAIKVLELARDATVLRTSYLANAVGHPSAVNVLDTGTTEDGAIYLVMELLEATSMHELMRQHEGHLPVRLAATIADQALDLLVSAHGQRIVHGEIELDKLFFTRTERVKVLGFGKPASDQAALDDVRELSKVIACLLCGEPVESLQASTLQPRLPTRIASVLERGMSSDPAQQWKSAQAMRTALQLACQVELGRPIDRTVQPMPAREASPRRPKRGIWLAGAAALIAGLYVSREAMELATVQAPEAQLETDRAAALQPPAKAQADAQSASPPADQAEALADADESKASAAPDASTTAPVRNVPRKPNRPELRMGLQRKSGITSTNIAPASRLCAQLSSARRTRQLSDHETQVFRDRCDKR